MNRLLQGSEKRQLQLAESLIQRGDWISIKELARELDCSERTLNYDLKDFQNTFSDFSIETSHHGIRLLFDDNKGLKNIYTNIFDSSHAFNLLETIFFQESYSVSELAEMHYISQSTLYRVIQQINQVIEKDGFYIQTSPCRIVGEEENIRFFYYQLFFEKYTIMNSPYNSLNYEMVNDLSYYFMELTEFNADFAYYHIARLIFSINLQRYNNGHYISPDKNTIDLTDILSKLSASKEYITYFEKRFKLKINKEFIIQISNPFIRNGFSFNYSHFLQKTEENKKIKTEVDFLRNLLDDLSEKNTLLLTNKEKVVYEVYNASYLANFDPRSGYILYNRNRFFVDVVKEEYPKFFKQLSEGIKVYLTLINSPVVDKNINYLIYVLFTEWDNLILELNQQSQKAKILIISNRNLAHSYLLKDLLESKFNSMVITEVYNDTVISERILERLDHDFIVTNFPIPSLKTKESIYIENFPNPNEIFQIEKKIQKILFRKKQEENQ